MYTLQQLEDLRNDSRLHVAVMQRVFDRHNAEADRFKGDTTRSAKFIDDSLREAREKAMADLSGPYQALVANTEKAKGARELWDDKQVVLSRIPMATDPVADATLRTAKLAEFAKMHPNTLNMIAKDAAAEGNLPVAWLASISGAGNPEGSVREAFSLSDVTIPQQQAALGFIGEVFSAQATGEMLVGQTSGRISGATKVALARRIQDGAPAFVGA